MRREITLRRAAALRELASLGIHASRAASLLDIDPVRVHQIKQQFGIPLPKRPADVDTPLRQAIRRGYEAGLSYHQIAERAGTTYGSVKTTVFHMGLANPSNRAWFRHKRSFALPPQHRAAYRELRSLGLTIEEAGYNLGLIERPSVEVRP